MSTHCQTCGGEIGVFCFNPIECAEITHRMQEHYVSEDHAQLLAELDRLQTANAAMTVALEFYADTNTWRTSTVYACGHYGETRASKDAGSTARAALKRGSQP